MLSMFGLKSFIGAPSGNWAAGVLDRRGVRAECDRPVDRSDPRGDDGLPGPGGGRRVGRRLVAARYPLLDLGQDPLHVVLDAAPAGVPVLPLAQALDLLR